LELGFRPAKAIGPYPLEFSDFDRVSTILTQPEHKNFPAITTASETRGGARRVEFPAENLRQEQKFHGGRIRAINSQTRGTRLTSIGYRIAAIA
jgi:hypothetical protein